MFTEKNKYIYRKIRAVTVIWGKREAERNEKEKNTEATKEASSGFVKLFISLLYNYVFKFIQVLLTPRPLWLLSIFQYCLKSYD